MLGDMIGDIAGSKYEFNNTFDYDFEMFGEGCDFTDDTICTVTVADAILNGRSYQESLLDWCRSYYEDFDTRDYPKGKFDETCMDAVPLSFYLLSQASFFEDAIRLAISHGGDSDTIGAIVGSIAEARFGIPQDMKDKAMNYLPKNMTRIYQQFKANNEIKKIDKKYKK